METSKNPSFRVSGSQVTDNPETWINPAKPEDIFGNVLMLFKLYRFMLC